MPSNDREVFNYFRSQAKTTREIDYLAYASYAYDRYQWMERFEELNGRPPSFEEENTWISHLPNSRLDEITADLYNFFDFAARKYMTDEIQKERDEAVKDSILNQVERATSFKSTFFPNLFIGVIASFLFSCLVIGMGLIYNHDPSPIALYKAIVPSPAK